RHTHPHTPHPTHTHTDTHTHIYTQTLHKERKHQTITENGLNCNKLYSFSVYSERSRSFFYTISTMEEAPSNRCNVHMHGCATTSSSPVTKMIDSQNLLPQSPAQISLS